MNTRPDKQIVEYHCHILPEFDDGAKNIDIAVQMVKTMFEQEVYKIVATPHYYAHRGESVDKYIVSRNVSYKELIKNLEKNIENSKEKILLGAEVAIEQNISALNDIEKLTIAGTRYILLEMPYITYEPWIEEEIYNISCMGFIPILAHVERYENLYPDDYLTRMLNISNGIAQFNNESLKNRHIRNMIREITEQGYDYILGSDSHDIKERRPDWSIYKKKKYKKILDESVNII